MNPKLELRAVRRYQPGYLALPAGFGRLRFGQLEALVETSDLSQAAPKWDYLRRYRQALDLWWDSGRLTVVPVRAGQIAGNPVELAETLSRLAQCFEQNLEKLAGKLETTLRLALPVLAEELSSQPKPAATGRGTLYIQQLAQRQAREAARATQLQERLTRLAKYALNYRGVPTAPGAGFAQAAFLVDRSRLSAFEEAVRAEIDWPVVVSAPLPPFSFV